MQENSNNIVYLTDYKRSKANADKASFLRSLGYDAISATLRQMGRGPIMPSENVLEVLNGQKINLATIGSLPTMRQAVENSRFDLMTLVTDLLHELKNPEHYGVPMDERGKVLLKSSTGALSQQSDIQYPFVKQDRVEQPNNVINLSDYIKDNPEVKQEIQQNDNVVSLTSYMENKKKQAQENSGKWAA